MIEAIIFDYGNVIEKFDNRRAAKKFSHYSSKSADELYSLIYFSGLPEKYDNGLLTTNELYEKIVKLGDLKITKKQFAESFNSKFETINTTIDLIKRLKPNYKLGLLSNTSEIDYNNAIKKIKVYPLFDAVTVSYKLKIMKPDKKIFFDILKKLKTKPENAVYIDDIKKYSDAASKIGMHGINYVGYEKLIKELKKLDIKI
jgi:putative hydrolase of the HAD superfamily